MVTYKQMAGILKPLIQNLAHRKVLVDFEKAYINEVRIALPNAEIKLYYNLYST